MINSNVALVADAIDAVMAEDNTPVHPATIERAAQAAIGALSTQTSRMRDALRRMWRDSERYGTRPDHPATGGYRDAVRDLANELGVDLDG